MARSLFRRIAIPLAIATLALVPTQIAQAAPTPSPVPVSAALQPCVDQAASTKAQQWVCFGDTLLTIKDASGKAVNTQAKVAGAPAPQTTQVAPAQVAAAASDDYDTWCENGTICHRYISTYIEETKGNAAYGDGNGVIGNYDAIIRTNLNGRQAQWTVTVIWDNGPALSFSSSRVQCTEDAAFPIVCGVHNLPNASVGTTSATWRHNYAVIYGNRLTNSDKYHGAFLTNFTPSGRQAFTAGVLSTYQFVCPSGTGNCHF